MNWRINLGILLVSFFSLSFLFEDDLLKKVLDQLEKYRSKYPQEKIHLHFDKPYYAIGDTIWFKAYLVNPEKNQLTEFSKIMYVDLVNDNDSIAQTLLLSVNTGLASGDFILSDDLPDGYYRIRAYTNWMRNFGDEYFFDKTIYVGNPGILKKFLLKSTLNEVDVQFFPEGGNLLTGINSKVAFKALGADGLGIDAVGFITDQNKKKVVEFKTEHLGMGYFSLQPQKDFIYQATVQFSDGSQKSFPFPQVRSEGYSLSCSDSDINNLKVLISSASNTPEGEEVTLVAQSNGVVHYAAK